MTTIGSASSSQGEVVLPKLTSVVKGDVRIKNILQNCKPMIADLAEFSSQKLVHAMLPISTKFSIDSIIERMTIPDFDESVFSPHSDNFEDLVGLAAVLTMARLSEKNLAEYKPQSDPHVRLLFHGDKTFFVYKDKDAAAHHPTTLERLKSDLGLSDKQRAGLSGSVCALSEEDLALIEKFSGQLAECFTQMLDTEIESRPNEETSKGKEVTERSVPDSLKALNFALAVHTAAIRILQSTFKQELRREKLLEKEIQKERIEAERERKAEERIKDEEAQDLLRRILKEEVARFELLRRTIEEEEDVKEAGFIHAG